MTTNSTGKMQTIIGTDELGRQAVGLLLGARQPLVAHVVGIDAQRVGDARAELARTAGSGSRTSAPPRGRAGRRDARAPRSWCGRRGSRDWSCGCWRKRRIGIAELAADPLERRLHAQSGVGAHHQQVHEIRKAGRGARRCASWRCAGRCRCSGRHSRRCRRTITDEPEHRAASASITIGSKKNAPTASPTASAVRREEEIGDRARHRRCRPGSSGAAAPSSRRCPSRSRIVLGGVVEQALRGLQAGAAQRARDRSRSPSCSAMPAARRLTEPRACTAAMTPKASTAAARNTSKRQHHGRAVAEHADQGVEDAVHRSDLEIHQAVHDEVADPHPGAGDQRARSW